MDRDECSKLLYGILGNNSIMSELRRKQTRRKKRVGDPSIIADTLFNKYYNHYEEVHRCYILITKYALTNFIETSLNMAMFKMATILLLETAITELTKLQDERSLDESLVRSNIEYVINKQYLLNNIIKNPDTGAKYACWGDFENVLNKDIRRIIKKERSNVHKRR